MKTQLTFGPVRVTHLVVGRTTLAVGAATPTRQTVTMLNVGQPGPAGPAGAGVQDCPVDLLAHYILLKS